MYKIKFSIKTMICVHLNVISIVNSGRWLIQFQKILTKNISNCTYSLQGEELKMSQRAVQRTVSIRNATSMGDNPMPPTRSAPPKPLKAGSSRGGGVPPPPPQSISEVEMEAGGVIQHAEASKEYHNLTAIEKTTTPETSEPKLEPGKNSRPTEKSTKASDQIKGKFDGKQVEFLFI